MLSVMGVSISSHIVLLYDSPPLSRRQDWYLIDELYCYLCIAPNYGVDALTKRRLDGGVLKIRPDCESHLLSQQKDTRH